MMSPSGKQLSQANSKYAFVRVLLGAILLTAAVLKTIQLSTEPTPELGLTTSRWFLILVVEFEILLGLCLIRGVAKPQVWLVTLACFSVFACATFYKALSGEASCGCFGSVEVNPWYTLVLDVSAVVALVRWRPDLSNLLWKVERPSFASQGAMLLSTWCVIGAIAAWGMLSYEPVGLGADGEFIGVGGIVILEPELWIDKPFPLLPHIDIGDNLQDGEWVVLLYHHDCPHCQDVLPEYEQIADSRNVATSLVEVALIEVPPFGVEDIFSLNESAEHGKLSEEKDWFVQTPVEIRLAQGTVVSVRLAESLERDLESSEAMTETERSSDAVVGFALIDRHQDEQGGRS